MPTLPTILAPGTIAVYGIGDKGTIPSGAILPGNFSYGTVYNIWAGGATYIYGNNIVYWKDGNEIARLATTGGIYTILPARLVTKDNTVL